MKTIKSLFFLLILVALAIIGYQNQEYFLTSTALHIDITLFNKTYLQYTAIGLPNWAFWGICFVLGLLIASLRGMIKAFILGREIKANHLSMDKLKAEIKSLNTQLAVYIHDPYIKRHLETKAAEKEAAAAETKADDAKPAEPAGSKEKKA